MVCLGDLSRLPGSLGNALLQFLRREREVEDVQGDFQLFGQSAHRFARLTFDESGVDNRVEPCPQ